MSVEQQMKARLEAAFAPEVLVITNDSGRHAGHSGDDGSGASHFTIKLRSPVLAAMPRVSRHRAVHAALGDLNTTVHAIALDLG